MGIHEGVSHPLILLESALLGHAAIQGAQLPTLLLPVGHGRLVYGHLLPAVERQAERWEDGERQGANTDRAQQRR